MSIVLAVDLGGGFGKGGKIPWNIPEDMKHFSEVTKGGVCVMGRRTYEDMLEMWKERNKPKKTSSKKKSKKKEVQVVETEPKEILPGRRSFVITSNPDFHAPGATVVPGLRQAVQYEGVSEGEMIFAIGGYRLFIQALSWADTIHMTIIKDRFECDRFFPLQVLNKHYRIVDGKETDELYFVTYRHKR